MGHSVNDLVEERSFDCTQRCFAVGMAKELATPWFARLKAFLGLERNAAQTHILYPRARLTFATVNFL